MGGVREDAFMDADVFSLGLSLVRLPSLLPVLPSQTAVDAGSLSVREG